jgi:hypothetical protein
MAFTDALTQAGVDTRAIPAASDSSDTITSNTATSIAMEDS